MARRRYGLDMRECSLPSDTAQGLYMAVDLGGTNFRVCSIELHGNTTFSLTQSKVAIPRELMVAKTSKELFSFLAKQIERLAERDLRLVGARPAAAPGRHR